MPVLITVLQDENPQVRAAAACALGMADSPDALVHLLGALEDANMWVRYYAARSLGWYASPGVLEALAHLAQTDRVPMVRAAVAEALGQIGHPDALPPLLAAMRSPDPGQRLLALNALGRQGGSGAEGTLQWVAATDAEPPIVQAAIDALVRLATPEAVAALVALTVDSARREACIIALVGLGQEQTEWIAQGLDHAHVEVRRATVNALAQMKNPRASQALRAALQDEDESVRLAATTALQQLGET
ncbi:MAG: HEAT repeat domain-containing protein [Chloroflexi bacterium]|nr:HEAT repeat domain-containing protein [Chloroflexota bacterium]